MKRELRSEAVAPPVRVTLSGTAEAVLVTVPVLGVRLEVLERSLIGFALEQHAGNQTHAAEFLGVSRSALLYRMRKYRLSSHPSDLPRIRGR